MDSTLQRPVLLIAVIGDPSAAKAVVAAAAPGAEFTLWNGQNESPGHFAARLATTPDMPATVITAATPAEADEFEEKSGCRFDLRIEARDPAAIEQLRRACADYGEWTRLGLWGGAAGGIEMGAGSLLHSLRIPLRGLALCSVQAALMTFAAAPLSRPGRVLWVPLISAGLKAFSPGGGRIRPMVAISVQGALFAGCVQLLGFNPVGLALGGLLVGTWAALQGFFVQYLLLGSDLTVAYERLVLWAAERWHVQSPSLATLLSLWAALHAVAAATLALAAWRLQTPPARLHSALSTPQTDGAAAAPPPWRLRLAREFTRWQFWMPGLLVAAVLAAAGQPWEELAWLALRFVTVGFLLVTLLSLFQPAWLAAQLRRRGWWGPAAAFSGAFGRRNIP